jgi:hypothetical protein
MTAIVSSGKEAGRLAGLEAFSSIEQAFSSETREISHRVHALQNRPSPASLPEARFETDSRSLQELLFDAVAGAKILTSQVAMHLDKDWRQRLFSQLETLHDLAEWEEGDQAIQQSSFSTFLKAILSILPARRPGLGQSSAGHLIAAWTMGEDRLTIEFMPSDRVRWVLSRYFDGEPERFAGETSVSRLINGLAGHHPEHWFSHA